MKKLLYDLMRTGPNGDAIYRTGTPLFPISGDGKCVLRGDCVVKVLNVGVALGRDRVACDGSLHRKTTGWADREGPGDTINPTYSAPRFASRCEG